MKSKSIFIAADLIPALLDGRKKCMRRIMKPQPTGEYARTFSEIAMYQPGDILYVRETWHKYIKRVGKGESCHLAEFYGYKAGEIKQFLYAQLQYIGQLLKRIPHIQRIHSLFGLKRLRFPAWTELGNTQETVSEKIGCNEYQINQQTTKKKSRMAHREECHIRKPQGWH